MQGRSWARGWIVLLYTLFLVRSHQAHQACHPSKELFVDRRVLWEESRIEGVLRSLCSFVAISGALGEIAKNMPSSCLGDQQIISKKGGGLICTPANL